jgi:putative phosphoribosyl transferase
MMHAARGRGFRDRLDAGRRLADKVASLGLSSPAVIALPRGGMPVALEVAQRLGAPLDLVMVRKLGVPWYPELAAGAVVNGETPQRALNADVVTMA